MHGRPASASAVQLIAASQLQTGWVVGDVTMDDYHLRTIAVELRLVIVNVEYRYVAFLIMYEGDY